MRILILRQTPDIQEQRPIAGNIQFRAHFLAIREGRPKHRLIDPEICVRNVRYAPIGEEASQRGRWHQRPLKSIVERPNVAARKIEKQFGHDFADELLQGAQIRLGKVRMIKADGRDPERLPRVDRFPCDLIRITGFDQVGSFRFENPLDRFQPQQHAVTRGSGNKRRLNRVKPRSLLAQQCVPRAGDNQDMFIVRGSFPNKAALLR